MTSPAHIARPAGSLADSPLWHPFSNIASADPELILERAEGSLVWDEQGREYLDATAALWFCNVGYGRAEIAQAAQRQLATLPAYSTFGVIGNRPARELAEKIAALAPFPDARIFLTSGGSDSVETAVKLARRYWHAQGRPGKRFVVGRELAYHGMHAYGTSAGGVAANAEGLGELVADVRHVPAGDSAPLEKLLAEAADEIAAVIGEPVIGAGGVIPPPPGYWPRVAEACRRHDVLLIADEVITGWGRTGTLFGCQRYEFVPDMITFAKGVTSGYLPLGGVMINARVQEPFRTGQGIPFRHGYTYSGHAACCAAALANLDILLGERLTQHAASLERTLREMLQPLERINLVREVRVAGLLAGIELSPAARSADPALLDHAVTELRQRGILTRAIGGTSLQVSPALTISKAELARIATAFDDALNDMARGR